MPIILGIETPISTSVQSILFTLCSPPCSCARNAKYKSIPSEHPRTESVGAAVGEVGVIVGEAEGVRVGVNVGESDGVPDGAPDGALLGFEVGSKVGKTAFTPELA